MSRPGGFILSRGDAILTFDDIAVLSLLTFDDIPLGSGGAAPVPAVAPNEGGFAWIQAGIARPLAYPDLGYAASSGTQIAFLGEKNGTEIAGYEGEAGSGMVIAREERFDLVGLTLSAASEEALPATVTGTTGDGGTGVPTVPAPRVDTPEETPRGGTFDDDGSDLRDITIDDPGQPGIDDPETRGARLEIAFARSFDVLDFEGIDLGDASDASLSVLSQGYGGFAWTQAGIVRPGDYPGLGYAASSGTQMAFIGEKHGREVEGYEGAAGSGILLLRDEAFDLHGITVTAAFQDGLPVTVLGTRADGGTISRTVAAPRVDAPGEGPIAVAFGSEWRDLVSLSIDGPGYFGIDDLAFSTGDRLVLPAAAEASVTRALLQGGEPAPVVRSVTVLDFEAIDLGGSSEGALSVLSQGYGGFAWTQAGIVRPGDYPGLGYAASSGTQMAFIGEKHGREVEGYEGAAGSGILLLRDEAFDLHGITVTAAFQDGLPVTVLGTRADGGTISRTVAAPRVDAPGEGPIAVAFGSEWRDLVSLSIDGPGYFGIDDLAFSTGDRREGDTLVTWEGGSALLLGYAAITPGDIVFA